MDGSVRDRALALLEALPADAGLAEVVDVVRALDERFREEGRPGTSPASEPRFRLVFESSGLGIALVGRDGRLMRANRAFARMLGYEEDELAGVPFTDITHPDDIAIDYSFYKELVAGTRSHYQIDKRYLRKDGRIAWGRLTASLVVGEESSGVFGIGMVEDITEIRTAREEQTRLVNALNQSVKELTALHGTARLLQDDTLPESILFARVASLLPAAFQDPERTAARVTYGNLSTTTPGYAESTQKLGARFSTTDAEQGALEVVYLGGLTAGAAAFVGEERHLLDSIAEMLRAALDRKLAEQARRRSDERLSTALTATGLGLWEWDISTDRVAWSPQMESLAGISVGTFPGTFGAFASLTHADDRAMVQAALRSAMADPARNDQCEAEFRLVPRGGRPRWVAMKGRVLRDPTGRPLRVLGVGLDITSRRTLEDQLHQAQKMEAVGRLAGGVAHDFNNLLTVIAGNCELILGDLPSDHAAVELLHEIREASERAGGLTRQLLSFSRKNVIQPTVLDLRKSLRQIETMLRRLIGEDIDLRTDFASEVGHVRVDPGQLEQVLMNLVVNARDAMPSGGKLTIALFDANLPTADPPETAPRAGSYVVLSVADTGVGMDAATQARIFEPFFTTKGPGKGTGLGLSVAFGIVKQFDGHIAVESEPGRGSTFRVYLPRVDETARVTAIPDAALTVPRGTETVLVVEDEVMLRKIVRTVLLSQGYRVLDARSGHDAVALAEDTTHAIDLVLTDVVLPGMSGREVVEAVRAIRPEVSVLFISGYADDALVREGVLRSEVGFLQKPFSPAVLANKVREVLDAGKAERARGRP